MTLTDPIGDMFTRIRNGQMRSLNSIEIPSSNFRQNILKILKFYFFGWRNKAIEEIELQLSMQKYMNELGKFFKEQVKNIT